MIIRQQFRFVAPLSLAAERSKTYAVKGHRFGLKLTDDDRKALIAFLKTL